MILHARSRHRMTALTVVALTVVALTVLGLSPSLRAAQSSSQGAAKVAAEETRSLGEAIVPAGWEWNPELAGDLNEALDDLREKETALLRSRK